MQLSAHRLSYACSAHSTRVRTHLVVSSAVAKFYYSSSTSTLKHVDTH
jgi:hypothetical protein